MNIDTLKTDIIKLKKVRIFRLAKYFEEMIYLHENCHSNKNKIKFNKMYDEFEDRFPFDPMPKCFNYKETKNAWFLYIFKYNEK